MSYEVKVKYMGMGYLVDNYSYVGDIITLAVCISLQAVIYGILYFSQDKKFSYLKKAVHFISVAAAANLSFYLMCVYYPKNIALIVILRDIYHFCLMSTLCFFLLYMRNMLEAKGKLISVMTIMTQVVYIVAVFTDILSIWTGFGLHYCDGKWHDTMFSPFNIFYVYSVVLLAVIIFVFNSRIVKSIRNTFAITYVLVMAIMIYSAYRNINTFSTFTYILPVVLVMIMIHSRPVNDQTGALSGDSFARYIETVVESKIPHDYMVLKLNLDIIKEIPVEIGKALNLFWHNYFKEAVLFNPENGMYILAVPRNSRNGDTERKVQMMIDSEFMDLYTLYQIEFKIACVMDVDYIDNVDDLEGIVRHIFANLDDNSYVITTPEQKKELKLIKTVYENLTDIVNKEDLADPRVLAYCQPIRNMKTGKFDTAEALMRLELPGDGLVTPNIFIPVAEYYGYIHTLSKIMVNKVCKQIKIMEDAGIEVIRISVNFTASEIMKKGFCRELMDIIKSNGVELSKIGVELTESQNENDFKVIKKKIAILQDAGMTVYLDDIGTGYSNLDRIVRYDVDVVKFDRFFLLEAERDHKVVYMMRHLSQAFKDLKYKLLFEGVELEQHEELCMACGADYIQGFKYSKPIPIENYVEFLKD